jgi:hypothetical protein
MGAEADQRDGSQRDDPGRRGQRDAQARLAAPRGEHQKRQRQAGRQLHADAGHERHRAAAQVRAHAGRQRERGGQREDDQRVVVRAADGEHEQHGVQPYERDRPAPRPADPLGREPDQRDRAEARDDGDRLERPQRAADAEWHGPVAEQREQRAVRRVLVGPAEEREHFVARCLRGDVRVRVQSVQRAEPGKADVAEDVLGDQRRPEQQDHVREHDRDPQRAQRQRAHAHEDREIARAHHQRQRLKAARPERAQVQCPERPGEPWRPAAAARRHVLRRRGRGLGGGQEDGHDHREQPELPERTRQPGAIARRRPARSIARAGGPSGLGRRAGGGRGGLHRVIVAVAPGGRWQCVGRRARVGVRARPGQACVGECRIHPTRV